MVLLKITTFWGIFVAVTMLILDWGRKQNLKESVEANLSEGTWLFLGTSAGLGMFLMFGWCVVFAFVWSYWLDRQH